MLNLSQISLLAGFIMVIALGGQGFSLAHVALINTEVTAQNSAATTHKTPRLTNFSRGMHCDEERTVFNTQASLPHSIFFAWTCTNHARELMASNPPGHTTDSNHKA